MLSTPRVPGRVFRREQRAARHNQKDGSQEDSILDTGRLRESFAQVAAYGGDAVAVHFYSDWFLRHPELRDLFPVTMAAQRDHLIGAIVKIVTDVDRAEELAPFLAHLGVAHRKFGVVAEHHASLRVSFLATMAHFPGRRGRRRWPRTGRRPSG